MGYRATIILIVLVLIAGVAVASQGIRCEACGEPITKDYFETGGHYYHPEHFLCFQCKKPIKGRYTTHRGKNYHPECFEDDVALRCALCGGIIQGKYLVDFWDNAYHLSHDKETEACEYCGRFISPDVTKGGVRYSDGRYVCNICKATAVTNRNQAEEIMIEVAEHLRRFGIDVERAEVSLHIVGLKKMQRLSGRGSYRLTGFTDFEETRNFFRGSRNRRIDVYLLYGMPRIDVVSTLAHELTHVWQFTNGRLNTDPEFAEGSCNYASYLVLNLYTGREAEYVLSNLVGDRNEIYGRGFRRVKRYAETEGTDTWLDRLRNANDFPSGY